MRCWPALLLACALPFTAGAGCRPHRPGRVVVVYCSLDEPYARPILARYEQSTGVRIVPLFDTEAAKSVGLAQRIRQESYRPRADVFWSSEAVRLIQLAQEGLMEAYISPSAADIPSRYRDPGGQWTGFAARARVLACNRGRAGSPPRRLADLTQARWRGEVAMANPRAGTTATEAAALFSLLGRPAATRFYRDLKANGVRIVDGNAMSANWAAQGEVMVGLTDTDDAFSRRDQGARLEIVFPGQDDIGTLLIPNTAALLRGAPHPEEGRAILDYLLSAETELALSRLPTRQIPLHPGARDRAPEEVQALMRLREMKVDLADLARRMPEVDRALREIF